MRCIAAFIMLMASTSYSLLILMAKRRWRHSHRLIACALGLAGRVETSVKKSDFEFDLPERLIAQSPPANRSDARLMVIDRQRQTIHHQHFVDLPSLLTPDDLLVFNDTRVIPARLFGQKESGGKIEVLFERVLSSRRVLAQIRANRSPSLGAHLYSLIDACVAKSLPVRTGSLSWSFWMKTLRRLQRNMGTCRCHPISSGQMR